MTIFNGKYILVHFPLLTDQRYARGVLAISHPTSQPSKKREYDTAAVKTGRVWLPQFLRAKLGGRFDPLVHPQLFYSDVHLRKQKLLVGGFNPFETCQANWIISPSRGKFQNDSHHHLSKCLAHSPGFFFNIKNISVQFFPSFNNKTSPSDNDHGRGQHREKTIPGALQAANCTHLAQGNTHVPSVSRNSWQPIVVERFIPNKNWLGWTTTWNDENIWNQQKRIGIVGRHL